MTSLKIYNERQKKAITHDKGPLLVISGAGTGKTHVLTGRIIYLVLECGVKPEEILALTFTEKAAQEMIQRVDAALPLGYGEIWIKTFHGFCDSILRERGFDIGLSTDYKLLGEADLWMFLKRHLMDFDLDYYRPLGNPYKFLKSMQEHFSRLKDEDIQPHKYLAHAEKENVEKQLELARAFVKYEELLISDNCMDFGGLLFYTIRLLENRASVLAELQKRFKYILVDEFQDTNFAQNKIVTLLAQKNKNLTVVGDDDQSIYKWRGASLTNIQYFQKVFSDVKKVVLNENYRCNQAILDCAYYVIQKNNPNRLELSESVDKKLLAATRKKKFTPEIHHFESVGGEVDFVINKASDLFKRGMNTAILVRTNGLAFWFLEKLRMLRLPHQHFAQTDLFTKNAVKDLIAVLRVIADPWDNLAMYRFLSLPFWKIGMIEILQLMKNARSGNLHIFNLIGNGKFPGLKNLLDGLIEFARSRTVAEVISKFMSESGYIQAAEELSVAEDIAAFSEKVAAFEQTHPNKKVMDFLEFARLLEEVGDKNPSEQMLDPNSIKVLTIHAAKGLEFDAVFVPGLVNGKFPQISRRDPFDIPQELIDEPLPEGNLHLQEERRLFYVATTRAKDQIFFSYSDNYDGKKQWKQSTFIAEAIEGRKAKFFDHAAEKDTKPISKLRSERKHKPLKSPPQKLSYSRLDAFKTCPGKYQFRYMYNLQAPTPAALNFGSGIHNTLKDFYLFVGKNKAKKTNLEPILKEFYEKNWIASGYETRALQEEHKLKGWALLKRYYEHEKKSLFSPALIEKEFALKIGGLVLQGRIDRIDQLPDGSYEVIDYKTGANKHQNLKRDLQLYIYALACRDALKIPVKILSLYYLEDLEKVSVKASEIDESECKKEIEKIAEQIRQADFSPTPGFNCGFCDYRLVCPVAASIAR